MSKSINILDKDYFQWIKELSSRYRRSQIKAAVKVNEEMLRFYWELGRDIVERDAENRYGKSFYATLSKDLETELDASGFSVTNLKYSKYFYCLYNEALQHYMTDSKNRPQVVDGLIDENRPQVVDKSDGEILTQTGTKLVNQILHDLFSVPWGHHRFIIDKVKGNAEKALFYVHQTVENGWSRNMLLNFMDSDLYERQGKALTNFSKTLPDETSDLAQELTKDPYDFAFTGITGRYNERLLKDALLNNITQFMVELGTGFAYVGKEKDRIQAQYALESSSQPLGISEYELEKFYPEKVEGTIPTIKEIEEKLRSFEI